MALPGQTVVAPPFSGTNRAFPAQTVSISKNDYHHRCEPWCYRSSSELYRPNNEAYRGFSSHTVYHGGDKDVPGMRRYRPDAVPVTPGESRLFKSNRRQEPVQLGSPRISKVVHGAATIVTRFIPDHQTGMNRHL